MLYRADYLKSLAQRNLGIQKSAAVELRNFAESVSSSQRFDIFLSHSYADKEIIWGLKLDFESMGHSVYIDWVNDTQLTRNDVNKQTANTLRLRMKQCRSLFFATSAQSSNSKWMPWELGYFDAFSKSRVAICPIAVDAEYDFKGQEYLGLYPYVQKSRTTEKIEALWIHEAPKRYVIFDSWRDGEEPYDR